MVIERDRYDIWVPKKVVVAVKVASWLKSLSIVMLVKSLETVTNERVLKEWTRLEHTVLLAVGIYRL